MIEILARGKCSGTCERYVPTDTAPPSIKAVSSTDAALLAIDTPTVLAEAVRRGWSRYPLLCPDCRQEWKEKILRD